MKKKGTPVESEITSLTENLHTEFEIQELEERLETDPLILIGMFDQADTSDSADCIIQGNGCIIKISCGEKS